MCERGERTEAERRNEASGVERGGGGTAGRTERVWSVVGAGGGYVVARQEPRWEKAVGSVYKEDEAGKGRTKWRT